MINDVNIQVGQPPETNIYKAAEAVLHNNPEVKILVGQSLGGAVALEFANNN